MHILDRAEIAVLAAALEIEPMTRSVRLEATADGAAWDAMVTITFGPGALMVDAIELHENVLADLARSHPPAEGGRYVIHAASSTRAVTSSDPTRVHRTHSRAACAGVRVTELLGRKSILRRPV